MAVAGHQITFATSSTRPSSSIGVRVTPTVLDALDAGGHELLGLDPDEQSPESILGLHFRPIGVTVKTWRPKNRIRRNTKYRATKLSMRPAHGLILPDIHVGVARLRWQCRRPSCRRLR